MRLEKSEGEFWAYNMRTSQCLSYNRKCKGEKDISIRGICNGRC